MLLLPGLPAGWHLPSLLLGTLAQVHHGPYGPNLRRLGSLQWPRFTNHRGLLPLLLLFLVFPQQLLHCK